MPKALNIDLNVNANTGQAKQELSQLQQTLKQLTVASGEISKNLTSGMDLSKTIAQVSELRALLQSATNVDTGVLNFTKLNQSIQQANTSLLDYGRTLNSLGPTGQKAFQQLATAVSKSEIPIGQANGMLKQFGTTMKNTLRWQASSMLLHGTVNAIQNAWNYAQRLDKSLTNIQIVTKQSDAQMARFAESANKAARALSTSTNAYTDAALIYYQQGLADKAVKERTDVTVKMANVTGNSAEKVSNQMTAIWNNFDNGSKKLEYYADVITALGAATASSSEEIATGLSKFAAVADTVGLSYESATAALATITATTRQSADSVGTGLRTLFSRLNSLSLGKTLEDGVNLTKYTKALNTVGVSALDASGQLKNMDTILADLGERWGTLSQAQQTALAQTIGGVRQYVTVAALMDNYDFYKQNLQVAKNSSGELQKQAEVYEKSWAAARKHVQASAEAIYSDLIDDKFFTGLTNGFAGILHQVDNLIDGIGGIKGVLLTAGTAMATFNKQGTQAFIQNTINGVQTLLPGGAKRLQDLRSEQIKEMQRMIYDPSKPDQYPTQVEKATAQGINRQLQLQEQFTRERSSYTPLQLMYAQQQLADMETRNTAVTNLAQQATDLEAQRFTNISNLRNFQAFSKKGAIAVGERLFNSSQFESLRNGDTGQTYVKLLSSNLNNLTDEQWGNLSQASQKLVDKLASQLPKEIGDQLTRVNSRESWQNVINTASVQLNDEINNVINTALKGTTLTSEQRSRLANYLRQDFELSGREKFIEGQYGDAEKEAEDLANGGIKQLPQRFTAAQGITEAASMLGGLGMGISIIKSSIQNLSNSNMSGTDKALSLLTSFGMATPMLTNVAQGFKNSGLVNFLGTQEFNQSIKSALGEDIKSFKTLKDGSRIYTGVSGNRTVKIGADQLQSTQDIQTTGMLRAGGYAAAIAAITTAAIVLERSIVTANERLDELSVGLETAKTNVTRTQESYTNLITSLETHNSSLDSLNTLTRGSLEYRQQQLAINSATQDLIDTYGLSSEDYYVDRSGTKILAQNVQQRIKEETLTKAEKAQTDYDIAKGLYEAQKVQADYYNFGRQLTGARNTGYGARFALAEQYRQGAFADLGYKDNESLIAAYESGELFNKLFESSNAPSAIAMGIRSSLDDKFPNGLNDLQDVLVESIAADSDFQKSILEDNKLETTGINALINNIDSLSQRYASLTSQKDLDQLKASDEYQLATTNGERRAILARAIEKITTQKINLDKFNEIWDIVSSNTNQATFNALSTYQGLNYQDFQSLMTELTKSLDAIEDEETRQTVDDFYSNLSHEYGKTIANYSSIFGVNSFNQNYTASQMQDMIFQIQQFGTVFGSETRKVLIKELTDKNGDSLLSSLKKINLSGDVIADMFNIQQSGAILGDRLVTELLSTMRTDLGGDSGLFAELLTDSEFSDAFSSLSKLVESGKGINASNISDLIDSIPNLEKFLKITNINTQGIADTLEYLASGKISIDQISDNYLAAVSIAGGQESATANAFAWMDSYKEGPDVEDIDSDFLKMEKSIYSNMKLGQYANGPVQTAIEHLFGKDVLNQWLYDFSEGSKQSGTDLTTYMKNTDIYKQYIDPLMDMYQAGDVTPFFRELLNSLQGTDIEGYNIGLNDIMSIGTNGWGLEITDDEKFQQIFKTFEDFTDYIASTEYGKNLTPDMINTLVAQYAGTYGANGYLRRSWQINEGIAGLGAFTGYNYTKDLNGDGEVDEDEAKGARQRVYKAPTGFTTANQLEEYLKDQDLTHLTEQQVIDLLTTSNFDNYDLGADNLQLFSKNGANDYSVNTDNFVKEMAKLNTNIVSLGENPQEVTSAALEDIYNANNGEQTWDEFWQKQMEHHVETSTRTIDTWTTNPHKYTPEELFNQNQAFQAAMRGIVQWDENGQPILDRPTSKQRYEQYLSRAGYVQDENGMIVVNGPPTKTPKTIVETNEYDAVDLDKALDIMAQLGREATAIEDLQANYTPGNNENGIGSFSRNYFDFQTGQMRTAIMGENGAESVQEFYDRTGGSSEDQQKMMQQYDEAINNYNAEIWDHIIRGDTYEKDGQQVAYSTADLKQTSNEQMTEYLAQIAEASEKTAEATGITADITKTGSEMSSSDDSSKTSATNADDDANKDDGTSTNNGTSTEGSGSDQQEELNNMKADTQSNANGAQPSGDGGQPVGKQFKITRTFTGSDGNQYSEEVIVDEKTYNELKNPPAEDTGTATSTPAAKASGQNNYPGFASGYQGPATVGELGPEAWIHDGQVDIVGQNGRESIWVNPSDTILTSGQTSRLLKGHNQGFSGGWNNSGSIHRGGGGGGGRGGGVAEEEDDKWKDSWEPYHEISREVQRLTTDVENLNTAMERAFGAEKIQNMQEEMELLDQRLKQEEEYIREAEDYIKEYAQYLPEGVKVVDGVIQDYDKYQEEYLKKIYEAQEKGDKKGLEKLQREWQRIQTYEQHTDKLEERQQEQLNLLYQKADLALQQIQYGIDQVNNSLEESDSLVNYLLKHMSEDMFKMAESISLIGDLSDNTLKRIDEAKQNIADYEDLLTDEYANDEELINSIIDERNNLLKYNQQLEDQRDKIIKKLTYTIQEFDNEQKKATNLLSNYNTLIKNYTDLSELMGNSTINNTEVIDRLNDSLKNNMGLTIEATKSQLDANQANIQALRDRFASGELDQKDYDDLLQKLINEGNGLNVTLSNNLQSMLNFIVDEFETELERALTSFQDNITKGFGTWDELTAAADSYKNAQDVNTKAYDRVYQMNTLIRDMNNYMNDMSSSKNHNAILRFQQEVNKLKDSGVDQSQEELDVLRAQFELMQAQFDLEETQNAKNQVRLQRDMNGNWGYVYTADEDAMAEAQQNVDDKLKAYLDSVTALQEVQGSYMRTVAELEIQEQQLRNELNQLGHTDEDEERRSQLLKQIDEIEKQRGMYETSLYRMQDSLNGAVEVGHENIKAIWNENEALFNATIGALPDMMQLGLDSVNAFFDNLNSAEGIFTTRTEEAKDKYLEQYEEWAPYLEAFNVGLGDMVDNSKEAVDNLSKLNDQYMYEFNRALEEAVKWEKEYGQEMDRVIEENLKFIKSLDEMINGLRDLDNINYSVSISNVMDDSKRSAMFDTGGYTGAWGSGGKMAILHEKEQVFNAQDTANLLSAAQILRTIDTSANSMAVGLSNIISPKIPGMSQQIDQTVHIEASFPNAVNHTEIEEAFTNLSNKAIQYANRKN